MDNCNNTANHTPKVPFDPGWNDPPPLTFNNQQANRPRNFLNKRVAFPLSGGVSSSTPPPVNLPPMPAAGVPPGPPPALNPIKNDSLPSVDAESTLVEVKGILLEFLEGSIELGSKAADIKRRIDVMEEMWSSGKLNNRIHAQMKELACALRDDQPSKADDIHQALMVDHVSVVGTWMPGVKQLVHHCIARSELLAIDRET